MAGLLLFRFFGGVFVAGVNPVVVELPWAVDGVLEIIMPSLANNNPTSLLLSCVDCGMGSSLVCAFACA
ncbi:MAG: hypothetical protein ACKPKO_09845, partial [Candidatus Fonsibacter sp.]